MSARSKETLKDCGLVALGTLLTVAGAGKIIGALLLGRTALAFVAASFADQPLVFIVLLAVWAMVLVGGLSYLADSVPRLWRRARGADAVR